MSSPAATPAARVLDAAQVRDCARLLHEAERSRQQIGQFSRRFPAMSIDDAYAIQSEWVAQKIAEGRRLAGHKIGLTSRAMQMSSQIDEPDYGDLLEDMFFEEGTIPFDRFIVPRVELELAFVLGRPLEGTGHTVEDVLAATERVIPAVEIIDARIEQFDTGTRAPRRVVDTISDNAANAGVVLGRRAIGPRETDLRWVCALCFLNGVVEESGVAAAVLNHPANGVSWLAGKLARYGRSLAAGQIILSGSFIRPVPARRGDAFRADFGALGALEFRFD